MVLLNSEYFLLKVVKKDAPDENVGVICTVNGKHQVVEYSEISKEASNLKINGSSTELVYNAANICNHFMTFQFLNEVCVYVLF
jgi:UDP-N-acetylglucosamine/UDP-N-acetylgalactosamine diphosphorylase